MLQHTVVYIAPRPWTWAAAILTYPGLVGAMLRKRRMVRLLACLSIGLPGEGDIGRATALDARAVRGLLSRLRNWSGRSLSDIGVSESMREAGLVSVTRDIIDYANGVRKLGFGQKLEALTMPQRGSAKHRDLRILYVSHNRIVDHVNGYSVRTHQLAASLVRNGVQLAVASRPVAEPREHARKDGVTYLAGNPAAARDIGPYLDAFAESLIDHIERFQPDIVHAASNWLTGAAAAMAATRCGRPFVYEVRGFWEVTRLATLPDYCKTAGFTAQQALEEQVMQQADLVLTLSETMRQALVDRGIDPQRIELLPNCGPSIATEKTSPQLGAPGHPLTFGYVGSLVSYEGIDILIRAFARFARSHQAVELLIAGDGPHRTHLEYLAVRSGVADRVRFLGGFSPDQAPDIYRQISIIVLPRLSTSVTELVSPLKPLEAFAYGKPCLMSDIGPLREVATQSGAATLFRAGHVGSLHGELERLSTDAKFCQTLSDAGRQFVTEDRNWDKQSALLLEKYRSLM